MALSNNGFEAEIQSWQSMAESLREPDSSPFREMLNHCREYASAIDGHNSPFPTEGLFIAILFMQFKIIRWLEREIARFRHY